MGEMQMRRTYTDKEKAQGVALAAKSTQAQAARDLGVPLGTLRKWCSKASRGASAQDPRRTPRGTFKPGYSGNPGGQTSAEREAIRRLKEASPVAADLQIIKLQKMREMLELDPDAVDLDDVLKLTGAILDRTCERPKERKSIESVVTIEDLAGAVDRGQDKARQWEEETS